MKGLLTAGLDWIIVVFLIGLNGAIPFQLLGGTLLSEHESMARLGLLGLIVIRCLCWLPKDRRFRDGQIPVLLALLAALGISLAAGRDNLFYSFVRIYAPVLTGLFVMLTADPKQVRRFAKKFVAAVTVIAAVTTVLWLLGSVLHVIRPTTSVVFQWDGDRNANVFGYLYYESDMQEPITLKGMEIWKNCGIFTEPPMFGYLLCLAWMFRRMMYRNLKENLLVCGILGAAILSTWSVTAVLAIPIFEGIRYALQKTGNSMKTLAKVLVITAAVLFLLFYGIGLVEDKLGSGSGRARSAHLEISLETFLKYPVTGMGFGNSGKLEAMSRYNQGMSIGIPAVWALGGAGGFLLTTLPFAVLFVRAFRNRQWEVFAFGAAFLWILVCTMVFWLTPLAWILLIVMCGEEDLLAPETIRWKAALLRVARKRKESPLREAPPAPVSGATGRDMETLAGEGGSGPSLKKNFVMNVVLTVSNFLFPLISFPYVSRILLPEGTGRVDFATSLISYFAIFAQLGIPTYGIRACAKVRDDREKLTRTAHELLMINLIMSALTYAALFIAVNTIPRLLEEKALILVVSMTILLGSIGMEWLYKALEQYTYITARSLAFKLVALAAVFLLIRSQEDYVIYGGITIFAASASNVLNLINARKYIGFRPVGGYDLRRHLRPVAIFFAMACATTIYTHLDNVMLGFMATDADVGFYGAAVKIKSILVNVVTALGAVLLPRLSWYVEQGDMAEFRRLTRKALHFILLAAAPLTVYFIFFAREGILLLSGKAFEGSVVPMQVIMPTLLLIGITNILGMQILVPTGREKAVLYSEIAGAAVDVALNAWLIPRMQATGAAIGTLAAEIVVLAAQAYALRGEIGGAVKGIRYGNIAAGILLAAAAGVWVKATGWRPVVTLAVSAVLFFGVYGGFMFLRKEEIVLELTSQLKNKFRIQN